MLLRLALVLVALMPLPAAAQSLAGTWALKVEGATIFRFDIEPEGAQWKGTWWRPRTFAIEGDAFQGVSGPPVQVPAAGSKAIGAWTELTFPDNRPGAVPDVFRFRLLGENRAEMIYVDTGVAPFVLERVPASSQAGPWQPGRKYRRATVASLGLPPEAKAATPAPAQAAPASRPSAQSWSLPPSTAKPPEKPVVTGR